MVALMLSHFRVEKHEFVATNGQLPLIQDLASLVANFTVSDTPRDSRSLLLLNLTVHLPLKTSPVPGK